MFWETTNNCVTHGRNAHTPAHAAAMPASDHSDPLQSLAGGSQRLPRICFGDLGDPIAVSTLQKARVDRVDGRPGCFELFLLAKSCASKKGDMVI